MNVNEGITVAGQPGADDGVNSAAGFEAALAAKVAGAREPTAAPAEERRAAPVAPDYDSEAAIKAQLLSEEGGTSIEHGLQTKNTERERIRQDYRSSLEALGIDPDEPVAPTPPDPKMLELAELRQEKAVSLFWDELIQGSDEEIVTGLARLKQSVGPDVVEDVLWEALGIDEDTPEDSHLWDELDRLEQAADQHAARAEFQAATAMKEALEQVVSRRTLASTKAMVNQWARDEGLSGAEARARITQVEQFMGRNLAQVAQQEGVAKAEDLLRAGDALLDEGAHAERVARFKEAFVAEPSTSVSEGLTINAGMGHVPLVPRPEIGTQIDPDRVARRAAGRGRTTAADIRRSVMAQSQKDAEYAGLQRLAGEMAEALRPKPRTPAGF